ncbi:CopD family protein [Aquabacterium sp. OR-4]|uniref:CopD family protein n=1 Tax=Aquabacterium sp. OR-4 TaxID=2978127 RepID=UPI0028C6F448|nr:CopD family protein [Aquabacterium sp. OR-4]MDT7833679.1 CopD family protein [Aquabacterium sp. OR-4]
MNLPTVWTLTFTLHLLAAVLWVGGMAFAHFALRPSAAALLEPPQRLPLLAATLGRFFGLLGVAVPLILATGLALLLRVGMAAAPPTWHAMLLLGLVMAAIFVFIVSRPYPRLRRHVAAREWPAAGAAMAVIRRWVLVNLVLGTLTVVVAGLGRG